MTILIFIVTLLILVVIHELGHFLVAKKFGIKVLEFGFGIPPRAWGKKVGETLVSINWLPFGGFVRLYGEDEIDKKILADKRSFASQTVSKRMAVVVAGVAMNFLLAWIIFYPVLAASNFKAQFPLLLNHQFVGAQSNETVILVRNVVKGSPAETAGIKKGDVIFAINNQTLKSSQDLIDQAKDSGGREITITLTDPERKDKKEVKVTPRIDPPAGEGPLGVALAGVPVATVEYTGYQKVLAGPVHSWNIIAYSGKVLGNLISQSFKTGSFDPVSQTVAGPVGVSVTVNDILTTAKDPFLAYLDFVAILSLNLAVFNVLPIPALDGGRLFFLMLEGVIRRKVKAEIERWVHTIGFALLLTFLLLVTLSDLRKLFF